MAGLRHSRLHAASCELHACSREVEHASRSLSCRTSYLFTALTSFVPTLHGIQGSVSGSRYTAWYVKQQGDACALIAAVVDMEDAGFKSGAAPPTAVPQQTLSSDLQLKKVIPIFALHVASRRDNNMVVS